MSSTPLNVKAPVPVQLPVSPASPETKAADTEHIVERSKWNTKALAPRLATDFVSALCAAGMVAPLITIIDRGIMENASGVATLKESLLKSFKTLLFRPQTLLLSKPFFLIWMLYGGTYLTANTLDTATSTIKNEKSSLVTAGPMKFAASSTANIGLCLIKDRKFAQLFGTGPARPVGMATMSLFAIRDCMTIFASFNIPPLLGPKLSQQMGELDKTISGQTIAQFCAPAAIQAVSTPLHLLGLDLYNRSGPEIDWKERARMIAKNWGVSAAARVCRIVPAFGIGGVVNAKVRKNGMALWE